MQEDNLGKLLWSLVVRIQPMEVGFARNKPWATGEEAREQFYCGNSTEFESTQCQEEARKEATCFLLRNEAMQSPRE